ncbi:hypothetical protein NDU88_008008 [Pleurodeles waltl]|uniref:Uncharacterized protein n=1 Tax=Pleurodeles waltl TaxID=8319 RepID=A0AAV7VVE7_PLEWA|nr:hypothetical protein NDU88_008008 [Pleurodeles waltl]
METQGAHGPAHGPIGAGRQTSVKQQGGRQRSVRRVPPVRLMEKEGLRGPRGIEVWSAEGASVVKLVQEEEGGSPQALGSEDWGKGEWQQDMVDLRVPIAKKWPTMLQWSSSEDEEEQEGGEGWGGLAAKVDGP